MGRGKMINWQLSFVGVVAPSITSTWLGLRQFSDRLNPCSDSSGPWPTANWAYRKLLSGSCSICQVPSRALSLSLPRLSSSGLEVQSLRIRNVRFDVEVRLFPLVFCKRIAGDRLRVMNREGAHLNSKGVHCRQSKLSKNEGCEKTLKALIRKAEDTIKSK